MNDEQLLQLTQQGDEKALAELYNRYWQPLFVFARRILNDRSLAEDAVQEAFVRVLQKLATYDSGRGKVRGWLFRITYNLTIDITRKRKHERPAPSGREDHPDSGSPGTEVPDPQPTPEDLAIAKELRAALNDCIKQLPPEFRAVLQLVYLEGFKIREAAEILELPLGTVQSRSGRARALLYECLQRNGIEL